MSSLYWGKQTYKNAPDFMSYCRKQFPKLYAVFFSCYKGNDSRFLFEEKDIDIFLMIPGTN